MDADHHAGRLGSRAVGRDIEGCGDILRQHRIGRARAHQHRDDFSIEPGLHLDAGMLVGVADDVDDIIVLRPIGHRRPIAALRLIEGEQLVLDADLDIEIAEEIVTHLTDHRHAVDLDRLDRSDRAQGDFLRLPLSELQRFGNGAAVGHRLTGHAIARALRVAGDLDAELFGRRLKQDGVRARGDDEQDRLAIHLGMEIDAIGCEAGLDPADLGELALGPDRRRRQSPKQEGGCDPALHLEASVACAPGAEKGTPPI